MKKAVYLLTLLLIAACKKDSMPYYNEFNTSLRIWNNYKVSANNSYSYISYSGSVFGPSSETKITVQNGKVVGRYYTLYTRSYGGTNVQLTNWTEDQSTLNTHTDGAKSLTLDQIYQQAQTEWLTADKTKNDIYFETSADGLISSAGYIPHNCVDDCFIGVNIRSITRL